MIEQIDWIFGQESHPRKRRVGLSISSAGISLLYTRQKPISIPFTDVFGWEFVGSTVSFSYLKDASIHIRFKKNEVAHLKSQFNRLRLQTYLGTLSPEKRMQTRLVECTLCQLAFNATSIPISETLFCPECLCIFRGKENLSRHSGCEFNFDENGRFVWVGKSGAQKQSARLRLKPLRYKMLLYFVGALLWTTLLLFFPKPVVVGLLFIHLFFLGCYLTNFLIYGKIRPLFFPLLWEKMTTEELLAKHRLQEHPGHLSNLAQNYFSQGKKDEAWDALKKAIDICPNHPVLLSFAVQIAPEPLFWEIRLKELIEEMRAIPLTHFS